jgi:acyl carrier protein
MIPSHFVLMEKFPLTLNGKIDRRALQASDLAQVQSSKISMQTHSDTERAIASIWCELLNLENVSADDDFFELGGKSLIAMRVIARICQRFDVDLTIRNLFEHPTVAGLAKIVDQLSWAARTRNTSNSADREEIRL